MHGLACGMSVWQCCEEAGFWCACADEFDLCCMLQKVQGHISSKRPTCDIVFNEEFISKPLTKCWSGNRWTNVWNPEVTLSCTGQSAFVAKHALILACTVNFTAYCFMLWMYRCEIQQSKYLFKLTWWKLTTSLASNLSQVSFISKIGMLKHLIKTS